MESGSFFTVISSSFYGEIESEYHLLFLLLFTKVYTIILSCIVFVSNFISQ